MNQMQFEIICKIILNGAPALADELCGSLDALVKDRNKLAKKVEELSCVSCDEEADK